MIKKIKLALMGVVALALSATVALVPLPVSAKVVCRSGTNAGKTVDDVSKCGEKQDDADYNLFGKISTIINVILGVVGIVAVIMVILGGIQYTTAAGDPAKAKRAKDTILYGIIGLVISLLAFAIVNFVLKNVF